MSAHWQCVAKRNYLDIDKETRAAFIVVPIAPMTVVLDVRMMLVMFINPTFVVMVIGKSATRTDSNENDNQDGSNEILFDGFHVVK